jgi:hypothetical protein
MAFQGVFRLGASSPERDSAMYLLSSSEILGCFSGES